MPGGHAALEEHARGRRRRRDGMHSKREPTHRRVVGTTHKGDQSKLLLLTALYVSLAANHHSSDSIARHRVLALLSFFSNSLNSRPVQPRQTQSSPGQPSQAQPSPAQPSTAQRSPARTFLSRNIQKNIFWGASSGYQIWTQNWSPYYF
jgi:hypothetical protein